MNSAQNYSSPSPTQIPVYNYEEVVLEAGSVTLPESPSVKSIRSRIEHLRSLKRNLFMDLSEASQSEAPRIRESIKDKTYQIELLERELKKF